MKESCKLLIQTGKISSHEMNTGALVPIAAESSGSACD